MRKVRVRNLSLMLGMICLLPGDNTAEGSSGSNRRNLSGNRPNRRSNPPSCDSFSSKFRGGKRFDADDEYIDDEEDGRENLSWYGSGREWDMFDFGPPRGGDESSAPIGQDEAVPNETEFYPPRAQGSYYPSNRKRRRRRSGARAGGRTKSPSRENSRRDYHEDISNQGFMDWLMGGGLPRLQLRAEPQTIIKVRKTLRPLKTILTLGADFNMGLGIWQFKSGWEEPLIGGRLTLAGRELQMSKTWLLSVGVMEDLVTRLRFKAAVDMSTRRAYARLGFRTERLSPINVVEGFTGKWMIPLDRPNNKIKLEVKANFAFPEPEIEYSTENARTLVGMGDIEVSLDELNLVLNL